MSGFPIPSIGLRLKRLHVDIHYIFDARHDGRSIIGKKSRSLTCLHSLTGIDVSPGAEISAQTGFDRADAICGQRWMVEEEEYGIIDRKR